MSLADSEAAFGQHCNKLVTDGSLTTLPVNHGIKSLSALAFASGTPQAPPTEEQFKDFATQVNGGTDMSFGVQAHLKRLHFDASARVMAELISRASDTSTDGARKTTAGRESSQNERPGSRPSIKRAVTRWKLQMGDARRGCTYASSVTKAITASSLVALTDYRQEQVVKVT